jgi:excisionase family DNA binding protein
MKARVKRLIDLESGANLHVMPPGRIEDDPPLLPLYEAAKRMGIGLKTLQRCIADGTIFSIPVGASGKYRKVPVAEVEKWRVGRYGAAQPDNGLRHV